MIRPADPAEKSIFTADFKGQVSIGQVWVRMQIKSKPNARLASLQQTKGKVMMFGSQGSKRDDKISTRRRVWGTLGEKKVIQIPTTNGLLLSYHEEIYNRICEKMSQLPSTSQPNSHSSTKLT